VRTRDTFCLAHGWPRRARFIAGCLSALAVLLTGCATDTALRHDPPRSPGAALVQRMTFPPLQLTVPRVGREVERRVLSNGMVLYLVSDRSLPVLNAYAVFRAGSLYEPTDRAGLAQFTASQLRSGGTAAMAVDALNEELEVLGVSIESGIGSETISLTVSALAKNADRSLELLAEMIRRPAFATTPLQTYRGRVVDDLRRVPDNPSRLMTQEFARAMYTEAHPLGRPLTAAQAQAIQPEDLKAHHRRFVRPDNMFLAVVGDFSVDELAGKVQAHFGDWTAAGALDLPPLPKVEPRFEAGVLLLSRPLTQSNVVLGHFGISRANPDRYAIQIMDTILGGGGFSSRIMERVRTEEGLAYSVASSFPTSSRDVSLFRVTVQTKNENVPRAVRAILEEMRRMQNQLVSPAELDGAKEAIVNSFVFRFTSRFSVVTQLLMLEFDEYPPDYLDTLLDRYRAVTREDVQRVARQYLRPDTATVLVVGDVPQFESGLTTLGPVRRIAAPAAE
jgi:zinc protease